MSISTVSVSHNQRCEIPCAHCGLPTPCSADSEPSQVFCCRGCQGAYELIRGWGLEDYYALRDQSSGAPAGQVTGSDWRFEVFDQPEFLGRSAPRLQSDGLFTVELGVHGLHCAACAWLIENAAARTGGWKLARVKMSDHTIRIVFDADRIRLSQIAALLDRLGYALSPLTSNPDNQFQLENRKLLTQIAIAGFCAANAMWIAIALYAGDAAGMVASHRDFLRIFGTGLGVTAVVLPGRTFFIGALASLRTRTPHMDLPVALGLAVGTVAGVVSAWRSVGDVYFDSLATLVFLLLIGRWIQFHQQHRAAKAVDLLLRLSPRHANRLRDGRTELVLVDRLNPGDLVRVAAGESVPVDGDIVAGRTLIDQSLLTGESQPVSVAEGDSVCAGTVNQHRTIDVCVTATGRESRIGRVMETIAQASADKPQIVQLGDRVGGVFVVVVTILASVTFLYWSGQGWTMAASHATALLIVACPCALALATPLAIAVSLGRAAKHKILIRDGSTFQRLSRPGTLWFDKTGTLTEGRIRVEFVHGSREAIPFAASIEQECCHPIADGIVRFADLECANWRHRESSVAEMQVDFGGVQGIVEGKRIHVGNLAFMQSSRCQISDEIITAAAASVGSGASPILIAIDGVAVTVLKLFDPIKPDAKEMLAALQAMGWQVGVLSGDHCDIVLRVARSVGVPTERALGNLSPEEKLGIVRGNSSGRCVVMVGDGANDAAALAAADVGIAVRGGAEVSLQAAPVFVSSGELTTITDLFRGSRRVMWVIVTAFAVSLGYNVGAVSLAMLGQISPLAAAILMPLSSVSVLSLVLAWPTIQRVQPAVTEIHS